MADRGVSTLKKMLSFFFRSSRSLPLTLIVLLIVRRSDQEHLFQNKVSGILRELLNLSRRRLDVCHASTHGVALVRI